VRPDILHLPFEFSSPMIPPSPLHFLAGLATTAHHLAMKPERQQRSYDHRLVRLVQDTGPHKSLGATVRLRTAHAPPHCGEPAGSERCAVDGGWEVPGPLVSSGDVALRSPCTGRGAVRCDGPVVSTQLRGDS
jgi:hypothetical protein